MSRDSVVNGLDVSENQLEMNINVAHFSVIHLVIYYRCPRTGAV